MPSNDFFLHICSPIFQRNHYWSMKVFRGNDGDSLLAKWEFIGVCNWFHADPGQIIQESKYGS